MTTLLETDRDLGTTERAAAVRSLLAAKPDGVLETVARETGASVLDVLRELPAGQCVCAAPSFFHEAWEAMTHWGDILLIVHTADIIVECKGCLPSGSSGSGYWNFHGDGPIGGHLALSRCTLICFVDRPFHGRRSCSVQFLNATGNPMVKVFVRRGADRSLDADQTVLFENLRMRAASLGPGEETAFA